MVKRLYIYVAYIGARRSDGSCHLGALSSKRVSMFVKCAHKYDAHIHASSVLSRPCGRLVLSCANITFELFSIASGTRASIKEPPKTHTHINPNTHTTSRRSNIIYTLIHAVLAGDAIPKVPVFFCHEDWENGNRGGSIRCDWKTELSCLFIIFKIKCVSVQHFVRLSRLVVYVVN